MNTDELTDMFTEKACNLGWSLYKTDDYYVLESMGGIAKGKEEEKTYKTTSIDDIGRFLDRCYDPASIEVIRLTSHWEWGALARNERYLETFFEGDDEIVILKK